MSENDYEPKSNPKGGSGGKLRKKKKDKRKEQFDLRGKYSSRGERQKVTNAVTQAHSDQSGDPQ